MSTTPSAAPTGIDLSLQRITTLLERLGSPQVKFPVIHVAGTNAKGSTTSYLDSILTQAVGLRTGRFNSPHLVEERDACRIAGKPVDRETWDKAGELVRRCDAGGEAAGGEEALNCTSFELLTARALLAFSLVPAEQKPEILLVEVGLGGRLDATNVFPAQGVLASVLCPVDMDHEALLGNTLTAIATEKAAIVKPGGLLVVADQRREPMQALQEMQCEALRGVNVEQAQVGTAAAEVLEAVRQVAFPLGARVVKSYIPWDALSVATPSSSNNSSTPWATTIHLNARHAPSLYPSTSNSPTYAGTYSARAGDAIVPGPALHLPRTRAAITGALTALQTLWAIARDETPGGLGRNGSDPYEELRLKMAWALRDDRDAADAVRGAVQGAKWEGRGEWLDVELPLKEVKQEEEVQMELDEPAATAEATAPIEASTSTSASTTLHLLVDGAHNASAAQALRTYLDTCIAARLSSSTSAGAVHLRITYLLAFSLGKDVRSMLSKLLPLSNSTTDLASQLSAVSLSVNSNIRINQRVGLLEFTTPVEGMPWVRPLPLSEAEQAVKEKVPSIEVRAFEGGAGAGLEEALRWAAEGGDGKSVLEKKEGEEERLASLVVLAGSLYLVGDLYRFVRAASS